MTWLKDLLILFSTVTSSVSSCMEEKDHCKDLVKAEQGSHPSFHIKDQLYLLGVAGAFVNYYVSTQSH